VKELEFNVYQEADQSKNTGQETWNEQMTEVESNLKSLRYHCVVYRKENGRKGDRQNLKQKIFGNQ